MSISAKLGTRCHRVFGSLGLMGILVIVLGGGANYSTTTAYAYRSDKIDHAVVKKSAETSVKWSDNHLFSSTKLSLVTNPIYPPSSLAPVSSSLTIPITTTSLAPTTVTTTTPTTPIDPTPIISSTTTWSVAALHAKDFIAQQNGIPPTDIRIISEFYYPSPILKRPFQAITLFNQHTRQGIEVVVDLNTLTVENRDVVANDEERIYRVTYGALTQDLYNRLAQLQDTDFVTVTIVLAEQHNQRIDAREMAARTTLAAKYPEVQTALANGDKPMDVPDERLALQVEAEYRAILTADNTLLAQPLVAELDAQGFLAHQSAGLPGVTARLPKSIVQELASRPNIATIYLDEGISRSGTTALYQTGASSTTYMETNRAPEVWNQGYTGRNVTIAIQERQDVDFTSNASNSVCNGSTTNCFQYANITGSRLRGLLTETDQPYHATKVASAAASHSSYRGMADGATIISVAQDDGTSTEQEEALTWAFENGAYIISTSRGSCGSDAHQALDETADRLVRTYARLMIALAGNVTNPGCSDGNIWSPGKAWNVLTVGSFSDTGTSIWGDDVMAASSWRNPRLGSAVHEKPEVVAPGENITVVGQDALSAPNTSGSSFAAPQVAGLGALLIQRSIPLRDKPEALRAIIMATATHNIEGSGGIPMDVDTRDGAGGINAALAVQVAGLRGVNSSTPDKACDGPCWWGETIYSASSFDASGYRYYYFRGNAGDRVRVAMTWVAQTTGAYGMATNLQLQIIDPNNQVVNGGDAFSWTNSYEFVPAVTSPSSDLVLPTTGIYKIAVFKQNMSEQVNYLGIAWVRGAPATTGTYDDASPLINYSSGWQPTDTNWPRAFNGTHRYSNVNGATAQLYFSGSRITYMYTMAHNRGQVQIFIDSVLRDTIDAYSQNGRWRISKTWNVDPNSPHTIQVKGITSGKYVAIDAFIVDISFVSTPATYDDNIASTITYVGSWIHSSSYPSAYNSTRSWSSVSPDPDCVTFTFKGGSVVYKYDKHWNLGYASVAIDGVDKGLIDLYSSNQVWTQTSYSGLDANAVHTINITVYGQRNSSSADNYITLDAFVVGP